MSDGLDGSKVSQLDSTLQCDSLLHLIRSCTLDPVEWCWRLVVYYIITRLLCHWMNRRLKIIKRKPIKSHLIKSNSHLGSGDDESLLEGDIDGSWLEYHKIE